MRYKSLVIKPLEQAISLNKTTLSSLQSSSMSAATIYKLQVELEKSLRKIEEIISLELDD